MLVVGYGNDLRGDDAVGRRAAEAVAARRLPGIRVLSVPQLTPELAAEFAGCRCVVFVDASVADQTVHQRTLRASSLDSRLTHHVAPESLLAFGTVLGFAPGEAFVVTIPATHLELGTQLSADAAAAMDEAVQCIIALCGETS